MFTNDVSGVLLTLHNTVCDSDEAGVLTMTGQGVLTVMGWGCDSDGMGGDSDGIGADSDRMEGDSDGMGGDSDGMGVTVMGWVMTVTGWK